MAKIEHVVVLMLENRSFDNLFGLSPGADGIAGKHLYNLRDPSAPISPDNPPFHAGPGAPFALDRGKGPSHSIRGTNLQLYGDPDGPRAGEAPTEIGFVASYQRSLRADHVAQPTDEELATPMLSFTPAELPSIHELARQFVLCDRWFCDVPGPTMPNRFYLHAGTSAGWGRNDWKQRVDVRTIYENLMDAGKTWAAYYSDYLDLNSFTRLNHLRDTVFRYEDRFAADAAAGRLPSYTFIAPRFEAGPGAPVTSMQAPADIRPGDALVADVYEAIRSNAGAWNKTLLVVVFDEHGGFFDHVPPPSENIPNPDGLESPPPGDHAHFSPRFAFDRLGVRVPAILVSPWLPKGRIDSTRYQHTSILATLKALYGLPHFLTRRDASATPFDQLLDELASPRTDTPERLPRG
jgi:phospholipase C